MATSTYLPSPGVKINSIDVSDQCQGAVLTQVQTALNSSSFASLDSFYVTGMTNHSIELEMYMSYAASETYATLAALVGTQTTVILATTATALTTPSATAPKFTLTNCYLEELPLINATMGELSVISLTFQGGTLTTATS